MCQTIKIVYKAWRCQMCTELCKCDRFWFHILLLPNITYTLFVESICFDWIVCRTIVYFSHKTYIYVQQLRFVFDFFRCYKVLQVNEECRRLNVAGPININFVWNAQFENEIFLSYESKCENTRAPVSTFLFCAYLYSSFFGAKEKSRTKERRKKI